MKITSLKSVTKLCSIICLGISSTAALAGGPVDIAGSDGHTAVRYQNPNIILNIENGDLGDILNADAITITQEAFDLWNNVTTSNVNLVIDQTQIALDVDADNVETYLPILDTPDFNADDGLNPVIFDDDGAIINLYVGTSQSGIILGFAQSIIDVNNGTYIEGFAVINGLANLSNTKLKLTIAQEIGHFIGLDHSQINIDNKESADGLPVFCSTTAAEKYPLMYPVSCRDIESLHVDDISAVSALYPETNINDNYGILEGRFLDETGNAILGANIWAENISSGEIVSIVSDYLKQGTGFYRLYLPTGSYTLHANSINPLFTAGSGVGPYSADNSDASFTEPHPFAPVTYYGVEAVDDDTITITLNQTTVIDFSNIGKLIVPVTDSGSDADDDSIADLFGATSYLTISVLMGLLAFGRRYGRNRLTKN